MQVVSYAILEPYQKLYDMNRMCLFLEALQPMYSKNSFHNDLYATEVMQFCSYLLSDKKLTTQIEIDEIDRFALLIAALMHCVCHNGIKNDEQQSITEFF